MFDRKIPLEPKNGKVEKKIIAKNKSEKISCSKKLPNFPSLEKKNGPSVMFSKCSEIQISR